MKILVTGGLGFIGSHLTDLLVSEGHEVHIIDNLSTGSMNNLNEKAAFQILDITKKDDLSSFFKGKNFDMVCHQAAQISVGNSMANPKNDADVNITGTINLLDMCTEHKCKRIVFASSAAIYGNPLYLGVDEKHPVNPLSFYGLSKLTAEGYIRLYCSNSNLTYAILRYANVFGPRQKAEGEGGVVAIFSDRMKKNQQCFIEGDGEQTRDFIFVKDIAKANFKALLSNENITVNVSTGEEVSINALFEIMKKVYGYKSEAMNKPKRAGDITRSYLDNSNVINKLEWRPDYTLRDGLSEMIL